MKDWEDYLYKDTDILLNKLNIKDQLNLNKEENVIVVKKLVNLYLKNIKGNFDSKHLCAIHYYMFNEIYTFAGKYRKVNMYKQNSAFEFSDYKNISEELKELFDDMNNRSLYFPDKFNLSLYLGEYYYRLIKIHPFREGNGRSIREFIRELVNAKFNEYELDYSIINNDKNLRDNFILGITEYEQYPSLLAFVFYNGLVLKNKGKNKKR